MEEQKSLADLTLERERQNEGVTEDRVPTTREVLERLDKWGRDNRGIKSIPTTREGLEELWSIVEAARVALTGAQPAPPLDVECDD